MSLDLLHTIAQVAVAMAGFSGVSYALGDRAGRTLDDKERSGVIHMLLPSFGAVMISLVAIALVESSLSRDAAWRISCGVAGLYVIVGASRSSVDTFRKRHSWPTAIAWPTNIAGVIFGIFSVLVAFGLFRGYADVTCVSILIFVIYVSMLSFVSLLGRTDAAR